MLLLSLRNYVKYVRSIKMFVLCVFNCKKKNKILMKGISAQTNYDGNGRLELYYDSIIQLLPLEFLKSLRLHFGLSKQPTESWHVQSTLILKPGRWGVTSDSTLDFTTFSLSSFLSWRKKMSHVRLIPIEKLWNHWAFFEDLFCHFLFHFLWYDYNFIGIYDENKYK